MLADPVPPGLGCRRRRRVLGRHERLQPVALGERRGDVRRHPVQQRDRLGDLVVVPARPVLVGQEHEAAGGVGAGVAPRVLEEQQREQRLQHRLVRAAARA